MKKVIEKGPNSTPILAPEWDKADREGTLDALIKERNYIIRFVPEPELPKNCKFCGR